MHTIDLFLVVVAFVLVRSIYALHVSVNPLLGIAIAIKYPFQLIIDDGQRQELTRLPHASRQIIQLIRPAPDPITFFGREDTWKRNDR
jgi:hypothetical protein